jgi:hypothetical protein
VVAHTAPAMPHVHAYCLLQNLSTEAWYPACMPA